MHYFSGIFTSTLVQKKCQECQHPLEKVVIFLPSLIRGNDVMIIRIDDIVRRGDRVFTRKLLLRKKSRSQQIKFGCPHCLKKHNVYLYEPPVQPLKRKAKKAQVVAPAKMEIQAVIETGIVEETIGQERRLIDNQQNNGKVKRKLKIGKEWIKKIEIQIEEEKTTERGFSLLPDLLNVKAKITSELEKSYAVSQESKETFSEEIEIQVLPFTSLSLVINWKIIWQTGFILVGNGEIEREIPYRVATGLTFDQKQVKEELL